MATRILVVDDKEIIRRTVERYLQREGFEVLLAADGEEALRLAPRADLLILDLMLPKFDGLDVCRRVRATSSVPILMLTAKGGIKNTVAGLGIGADDYIVKPFSLVELAARVRAALRRPQSHVPEGDIIEIGAMRIDARTRVVEREGRVLNLTEREWDLLLFLARHPGETFTRQQLLEAVWDGAVAGGENTVTVYIGRLRDKIEPDPVRPRYLQTAWGVGYRLEA